MIYHNYSDNPLELNVSKDLFNKSLNLLNNLFYSGFNRDDSINYFEIYKFIEFISSLSFCLPEKYTISVGAYKNTYNLFDISNELTYNYIYINSKDEFIINHVSNFPNGFLEILNEN